MLATNIHKQINKLSARSPMLFSCLVMNKICLNKINKLKSVSCRKETHNAHLQPWHNVILCFTPFLCVYICKFLYPCCCRLISHYYMWQTTDVQFAIHEKEQDRNTKVMLYIVGVHLMTYIILTQHGLISILSVSICISSLLVWISINTFKTSYEYSTACLVISKCVHPAYYEVIPLCMIIINGTQMQFAIHEHGSDSAHT